MAERKRERGNIKRAADIIHKRGGTPSEARALKESTAAYKKALAEGKGDDKAKIIGNKVARSHFKTDRQKTNIESMWAALHMAELATAPLAIGPLVNLAKLTARGIKNLGLRVFGKTPPKTLESAIAQVRKKLNLGPNVPDKTITQKFINKLKLPGLTSPSTAKTKALKELKNLSPQNLKDVSQAMKNIKTPKLGPGIKLSKTKLRPRVVPRGKLRSTVIPVVAATGIGTAGKLGYDALKDKENIFGIKTKKVRPIKRGSITGAKTVADQGQAGSKNGKTTSNKTKTNGKTGKAKSNVNLLKNTISNQNAQIKGAGPELKNKKRRVKKRKTAAEEHGAWSEEAGKEWFKKYLPGIEVEYTYPTDPEDWDEMDPSGKTDKTIEEEFGGRQWWEKESNKHGGKVVKRRGGGKALRGFGKATYSDKLY